MSQRRGAQLRGSPAGAKRTAADGLGAKRPQGMSDPARAARAANEIRAAAAARIHMSGRRDSRKNIVYRALSRATNDHIRAMMIFGIFPASNFTNKSVRDSPACRALSIPCLVAEQDRHRGTICGQHDILHHGMLR